MLPQLTLAIALIVGILLPGFSYAQNTRDVEAYKKAINHLVLEEFRFVPVSITDMMYAGYFYCEVKPRVPYDATYLYRGNVANAATYAAIQWRKQHPTNSTDVIGITDSAFVLGDRYLCPGWPGRPRPQNWETER